MRAELGERGLRFDDDRPTVAFSELHRRYEARNPSRKRLVGYRVDGELLDVASQKACDYLLGIPHEQKVYLVELKGPHLRQAVGQLRESLGRLSKQLQGKMISGRVVLSRVSRPDIRASETLTLARALAATGGDLRYKSIRLTEEI